MVTQTITVAAFQILCGEVADAIAAADFATAYSKYAQAEAVNAGLELDVNSQGTSVRRRESLNGLQKALQVTNAFVSGSDTRRFIKTRTGYKR